MGYQEVMSLPMRVFNAITQQIDRILAYERKLDLEVMAVSHDPKSSRELQRRLHEIAPGAITYNPEVVHGAAATLDVAGLERLRAMC